MHRPHDAIHMSRVQLRAMRATVSAPSGSNWPFSSESSFIKQEICTGNWVQLYSRCSWFERVDLMWARCVCARDKEGGWLVEWPLPAEPECSTSCSTNRSADRINKGSDLNRRGPAPPPNPSPLPPLHVSSVLSYKMPHTQQWHGRVTASSHAKKALSRSLASPLEVRGGQQSGGFLT